MWRVLPVSNTALRRSLYQWFDAENSNTLPALALLFLAIGLLQHDGLCILFGHLANLCAFIYFIVIMVGGKA